MGENPVISRFLALPPPICYPISKSGDSMDFIMDCLVEGFLELFGEGFVYLCSAFVPNKNISERAHRIIGIVVLFVSLALFVGLIVGIFLLVETNGQSFWGWLLISLSVIYIVGGIALKIFSHMKK
mgnify:FL=1